MISLIIRTRGSNRNCPAALWPEFRFDSPRLGLGKRTTALDIPIAAAIQELRDQIRECVLEGKDKDIVFTPTGIEVELSVTFKAEATAKGGFKLLALLDLSAEAKAARESLHKIKLSLSVADRNGEPLKIKSDQTRSDLG